MLRTLAEKVEPGRAALLVIDVQNDFCHSEGATAKNGADMAPMQTMVPSLNRLIEAARSAGLFVVFIRTTHGPETDSDAWLERRLDREHYICGDGGWGAEWYGVSPAPDEPIVIKHRYSAFIRTELDELLRSRGIESLILTGTTTNMCVESTARDGFMLDYYVVFVDDCTATSLPEQHQRTLETISRTFGVVATSGEISAEWTKVSASSR